MNEMPERFEQEEDRMTMWVRRFMMVTQWFCEVIATDGPAVVFVGIAELSEILCAPNGGLGPSASSAAIGFLETYTNTLPATPILVGTPTAPAAANATDINIYPQCAGRNSMYVAFPLQIDDLKYTDDLSKVVNDLAIKLCGPLYVSNSALSASVQSAIATATAGAGSSISSSVAASFTAGPTGVQGAVGGMSGSSNGSITSPGGGQPPAPFTGAACRLSGENLALVVSMLVGVVGMIVMVGL
ncbi:MAG: hypothetical protein Q9174_002272 [Haloplaca sp. 1 TL-2023]